MYYMACLLSLLSMEPHCGMGQCSTTGTERRCFWSDEPPLTVMDKVSLSFFTCLWDGGFKDDCVEDWVRLWSTCFDECFPLLGGFGVSTALGDLDLSVTLGCRDLSVALEYRDFSVDLGDLGLSVDLVGLDF